MSTLCLWKPASWRHTARAWLADAAQSCQLQLQRLRDPYRPELHYMRGPGPKARAKQLHSASDRPVTNR